MDMLLNGLLGYSRSILPQAETLGIDVPHDSRIGLQDRKLTESVSPRLSAPATD